MKSEMRHKLARQSFEEKIREVGELIQLSAKLKPQRTGMPSARTSPSAGTRAKEDVR
jgi:hypothetical protein